MCAYAGGLLGHDRNKVYVVRLDGMHNIEALHNSDVTLFKCDVKVNESPLSDFY